ncbi:hypothetical protein DMN91_008518 [Ooceraea biroi]|uniref:Uncharacterized protein n=1 Tax=Ooceraea biroi TaxID=2015173 RepID=A0A3L8DJ47_OOCBI|nr:hypothetical protein DMN91_008518 [Ooceraea biroi]
MRFIRAFYTHPWQSDFLVRISFVIEHCKRVIVIVQSITGVVIQRGEVCNNEHIDSISGELDARLPERENYKSGVHMDLTHQLYMDPPGFINSSYQCQSVNPA